MNQSFKRLAALLTALMLAAALILAGCSPSGSVSGTPRLTKSYFEKNTSEVLKRSIDYGVLFANTENPFAALFSDADSGTLTLGINLSELLGEEIVPALSVAVDGKNGKGVLSLAVEAPDMDTADLDIYFDQKKLALSSKLLLGTDKAYGVYFEDCDTMIEKFDNSALAAILDLPEGAAASFCEQYGINNDYFKKASDAVKTYSQTYQNSLENVINCAYAALEPYYGGIAEEKLDIGDTTVDVLSLEVAVNRAMLQDVLTAYTDSYREMIEGQNTLYAALIPEALHEEVLPALTAQTETAVENVENAFSQILDTVDINGTVKYYLEKSTGLCIKAVAKLDITVEGETMSMTMNEYIGDGITFDAVATLDGDEIAITGALIGTADGLTLNMDMFGDGEDENASMKMAFETDKTAGTYRLYGIFSVAGETLDLFRAQGQLSYNADSFSMTVDNVDMPNETLPLGVTLSYENSASVKEPAEIADLLTLSEDELYELVGRLTASAQKLAPLADMFAGIGNNAFDGNESYYDDDFYGDDVYDDDVYDDDVYGDDVYDDEYADGYEPLSYDEYEAFAEYYSYEEFCEFVDAYNAMIAEMSEAA